MNPKFTTGLKYSSLCIPGFIWFLLEMYRITDTEIVEPGNGALLLGPFIIIGLASAIVLLIPLIAICTLHALRKHAKTKPFYIILLINAIMLTMPHYIFEKWLIVPPKDIGDLINAKSAKIYQINWDDPGSRNRMRLHDGSLNPTRQPTNGVLLSEEHYEEFLNIITREPDNFIEISKCHWPHHGIIFFDHREMVLGTMSICFRCSNAKTDLSIPDQLIDFDRLESLFRTINIPIENPEWYANNEETPNKRFTENGSP